MTLLLINITLLRIKPIIRFKAQATKLKCNQLAKANNINKYTKKVKN